MKLRAAGHHPRIVGIQYLSRVTVRFWNVARGINFLLRLREFQLRQRENLLYTSYLLDRYIL